jgi:hypothetical protein
VKWPEPAVYALILCFIQAERDLQKAGQSKSAKGTPLAAMVRAACGTYFDLGHSTKDETYRPKVACD